MKLLGKDLTEQELRIVKNNPLGPANNGIWYSVFSALIFVTILYSTLVYPSEFSRFINGLMIISLGTLLLVGIGVYGVVQRHLTRMPDPYASIQPGASCFDWPFGPVRILFTLQGLVIYTVTIAAYLYQGWFDLAVGMGTIMILAWLVGISRMYVARAVLDYYIHKEDNAVATYYAARPDVTQ